MSIRVDVRDAVARLAQAETPPATTSLMLEVLLREALATRGVVVPITRPRRRVEPIPRTPRVGAFKARRPTAPPCWWCGSGRWDAEFVSIMHEGVERHVHPKCSVEYVRVGAGVGRPSATGR